MTRIKKFISRSLIGVLLFTLLPVISNSDELLPRAYATNATVSCGDLSTPLDFGDITIRPIHGKGFYSDVRNGINAGYVGFEIRNDTGAPIENLWIGINRFRSGSDASILSIANSNEAIQPLGRIAEGGLGYVYFFTRATGTSESAQQQDITVYSGNPNAGGSVYSTSGTFSSGYRCINTFDKVKRTLAASANKVTQITSTSTYKVGGVLTITVRGALGTVGSGDAGLDGRSMIVSPASNSSWPSQLLRLENIRTIVYSNKNYAGSTRETLNRIKISETQLTVAAKIAPVYISTYTYRILGSASQNPEVKPIADIASGTQIKHTGKFPSTSTYVPLNQVDRDVLIKKSLDSEYVINKVGSSFRVKYKITIENRATEAVKIDQLVDLPNSAATLVAGSVQVRDANRLSFTALNPAPSIKDANGNYRFFGPFTATPINGTTPGTAELTYIMDLPIPASGAVNYSNKAFGLIGSSVIGSSETEATATDCALSISSGSTYTSPTCDNNSTLPKQAQIITFNQPPAQGAGTTYELDATSDSGLPVAYSVRSGPCVISGNVVTYQAEGNCVIVASQPGDDYYSAATSVIRSVTIFPAQFINYTNPTFATTVSMNTSATRDIVVTASSDLPVTLTSFDVSICRIGSASEIPSTPAASYTPPQGTNTFRITSYTTTGQCILTATQAGGLNASTSITYGAATPVENTIFVGLKTQVLSNYLSVPTDQANTSSTSLKWSVQSRDSATNAVIEWPITNPITFGSTTPSVCLAGDEADIKSGGKIVAYETPIQLLSNGLCILEANHDGDSVYGPANPIQTSFNIGSVPSVAISTVSAIKSNSIFQAEVVVTKPSAGAAAPTGEVTLYASGDTSSSPTQLGTVTTKVSGVSSSFTFDVNSSILAALVPTGNISLFATYNGSATYAPSQTASSTEVGVYSPALVSISRSNATRFPAETATVTVSVSGNAAYGTPAGSVTLSINDGGTISDPASSPFTKTLSSGSATFTVTAGNDIAKDIVVDASYIPASPSTTYFSNVANSSTTLANRTIDIQERTYSYTISYKENGGSGTIGDQSGTGTSVRLLPNSFTRSGYVFSGWNTKSDNTGTPYSDQQLIELSQNTTLDLFAIWTPVYTINFDANGGIGSPSFGSVSGQSGSTVTLASKGTLVKDGFAFSGWTRNSDGTGDSYSELESVVLSSSFTLYAKWATKLYDYSITFDCGVTSGTVCNNPTAMNTQSGTNSSIVTLNANSYTRSGYLFAGWATSTGGSIVYLNQEQITFTSNLNLNLFAVWQPVPNLYTVTFNPNGATGTASIESLSQTSAGQSLALATIGSMVRTGYKFTGWSTSPTGTTNTAVSNPYQPSADKTLYAIWEIVYTVTFNANGGSGSPSVDSVTQSSSGASVILASANTLSRTSFAFNGWNSKADGTGAPYNEGDTLTPDKNITLYAAWNSNVFNYDITYNPNLGSGTLFKETGSASTKTLSPNQFTRSGFVFRNWNTLATGNGDSYSNQQVLTFNTNTTLDLYATWDPVYTVTFDLNGASGSPTINSVTQGSFGSSITLASRGTMAISGYSFGGWSTSNVGDTPIYIGGDGYTPSGNITLYAVWNPSGYLVNFDSNGGSSVDSKSFTTGGSVAAPTDPILTGHTFNGWFTLASGGTQITFPYSPGVTNDVTVYAQWTVDSQTITYAAGTEGSGSAPTSPVSVSYGSTFVTPANTYNRTGYTFAGWFDGTSTYAAGATYPSSGSVTGNVTLTATWTLLAEYSYTIKFDSNGGSGSMPRITGRSNLVKLPKNEFTSADFTFSGWAISSTGTSAYSNQQSITLESNLDLTLFALWTPIRGGSENSNKNKDPNPIPVNATPSPTPSSTPRVSTSPSPRPTPTRVLPTQAPTPSPLPSPTNRPSSQTPLFTFDIGNGTQNIPNSVIERLGGAPSDPTAVLSDPQVKKMVDENASKGLFSKSLAQLGTEKFKDIFTSTGVYVEVVGSRAAGQFIISASSLSNPLALATSLRESVSRNRTDFAWIENVEVTESATITPVKVASSSVEINDIFAKSKLPTPILVDQISGIDKGSRISVSANVSSYKPGTEVFLVVTSSPIIFGSAIVDKNGATEINGQLPISILSSGAHTLRIVGTRNIEGAGIGANGEVKLSMSALTEIRKFDLGTKATVTVVGSNASGGNHFVIREIPIEMPIPWWTLLLAIWTAIIFIVLTKLNKIVSKREKVTASFLTLLSVLPGVWFGWTSFAYFIMGLVCAIGAIGIFLIWTVARLSKKSLS